MLPPIETPIRDLQVADACFYDPEDRGVSESMRVGKEMALRLVRYDKLGAAPYRSFSNEEAF